MFDTISKICEEPTRVDNPKRTDVPKWVVCRKCKKCVNRRHTDLAGRAMAESLCATQTVALTLTYGKHVGARSQYLFYRDVQLMLKRLRKDGYKVRYLVSGEYGTKRGRAHWHCVLFFYGKAPDMPPVETQKQNWEYWVDTHHNFSNNNGPIPLGYVFVQKPDFHGIRYVVKYAVKDEATGKSTRKVQMSLKPPLGADYWQVLAKADVKQGIPFSFSYRLPKCTYGNGKPVEFYTVGASAIRKWVAYRKEWAKHNKCAPPIHIDAWPAWLLNIVPLKLRAYTTDPKNRNPLYPSKDTYKRLRSYGDVALIKLHTGDVISLKYNGRDKEMSLCRVATIGEAIATARKRRVEPPRQLRRGEVPF